MNQSDFLRQLKQKIKDRSILNHPFYKLWTQGKLTRADLQLYAGQYYKHVAAFPQYLSGIHFRMESMDDRKVVLSNLMDEEHGEENHPKLWLDFGKSLGISPEEIAEVKALPETIKAVAHFKNATSTKSIAEGIAALYTYESQIPQVSEEKINGLLTHYSVYDVQGLSYFSVHMLADVEHSAQEEKLLLKYAQDEETQQKALAMVDSTLDAYWMLLDGVYKECAHAC